MILALARGRIFVKSTFELGIDFSTGILLWMLLHWCLFQIQCPWRIASAQKCYDNFDQLSSSLACNWSSSTHRTAFLLQLDAYGGGTLETSAFKLFQEQWNSTLIIFCPVSLKKLKRFSRRALKIGYIYTESSNHLVTGTQKEIYLILLASRCLLLVIRAATKERSWNQKTIKIHELWCLEGGFASAQNRWLKRFYHGTV